ncbi:hypothetical protein ACIP4T_32160 [Streptomyces massasporeus]|uniref:effector-associated constant component EACC1 n=1 Tax=Streptomyces massasporeus TaxID=67324 RepID=UPI0036E25405
MRVQLTVAADDGGETLTDLYCWLRQDRELRRHAEVRIQPLRQTGGHMGALEIIELVIAGTAAAAGVGSAAVAFASWRRARPRGPEVTFTVDGTPFTVRDADDESWRRISELLQARADASADGSDGDGGSGRSTGSTGNG